MKLSPLCGIVGNSVSMEIILPGDEGSPEFTDLQQSCFQCPLWELITQYTNVKRLEHILLKSTQNYIFMLVMYL